MDSIARIGTQHHWAGHQKVHLDALPFAQLSFSLAGEDVVLAHHFKKRIKKNQPGIYVDIGCAMPVQISNTYLFYCYGWRGICIDLNSKHTMSWASARPEDSFINASVSDKPGDAYVFAHTSNEGMARIAFSSDLPGPDCTLAGRAPTVRLSDILAAKLKPGIAAKLKPGIEVDFFQSM